MTKAMLMRLKTFPISNLSINKISLNNLNNNHHNNNTKAQNNKKNPLNHYTLPDNHTINPATINSHPLNQS